MREHRIEHSAEYNDANDDAYPKTDVMNVLDTHTHFGDARAHVDPCGKRKLGNAPQKQDHQAVLWPAGKRSHASRRFSLEGFRNDSSAFSLQPFRPVYVDETFSFCPSTNEFSCFNGRRIYQPIGISTYGRTVFLLVDSPMRGLLSDTSIGEKLAGGKYLGLKKRQAFVGEGKES